MFFVYFLALHLGQAAAEKCSDLEEDYMKLIAYTDEKVSSYLPFKVLQNYQDVSLIADNEDLKLKMAIEEVGSKQIDQTLDDIKLLKFEVHKNQYGDWANYYAIFRIVNENYQILYNSDDAEGYQNRLPQFDQKADIGPTKESFCHDFIIYSKNIFIFDCQDLQDESAQNYFLVIDVNQEIKKMKKNNDYPYNEDQPRKLFFSTNDNHDYLYRVTGKNDLQVDNQVEIFEIEPSDFSFRLTALINKQFFIDQKFTELYPDYINFEILDFKADQQNLSIVLLDYKGNLLFLSYQSLQNEWKFSKIEFKEEAFYFDYDFMFGRHIVMFKNSIQGSSDSYQFDYDISQKYRPKITKQFSVLTSDKDIILLKSNEIQMVEIGDFSNALFDQLKNEFLTIRQNQIHRYLMGSGITLFFNPSKNTDFEEHHAKLKYKNCTVQVDYQHLSADNEELVQVRKGNAFQNLFLISPQYELNYYNDLFYGPNKKVQVIDQNGKEDEQYYIPPISYEIQLIRDIYSNITYFQSVAQFQAFPIQFIIYQKENQELNVEICDVWSDDFRCSNLFKIQLNYSINQKDTQIMLDDLEIVIYTFSDQKTITILTFQYNIQSFDQRIFSLDANDEITNFMLSQDFLILWSTSKQLIKFHVHYTFELSYQIDSKNYQFFSPESIFTAFDSNSMYIFNKKHQKLFIVRILVDHYKILMQITLNQADEVKVLINSEMGKFILAIYDLDKKYTISCYDQMQENQIQEQKQIQLYKYQIQSLNQLIFSQQNSILYIILDEEVLIYDIDEVSHNSLISKLTFSINQQQIQTSFFNLFAIQDKKLNVYYIYPTKYMKYKLNLDTDEYQVQGQIQMNIKNNFNNFSVQLNQTFINQNMAIKVIPEKLNLKLNFDSNNQNNFVQDMGNQWYQGQVEEFVVLDSEFNISVSIRQPIDVININYFPFSADVVELSNETLLIAQFSQFLIITKENASIVQQYNLTNDVTCTEKLYKNQSSFIFSCNKNRQKMIVGVECQNTNCTISQSLNTGTPIKIFVYGEIIFVVNKEGLQVFHLKGPISNLEQAVLVGEVEYSFCLDMNVIKISELHFQVSTLNYFNQFVVEDYKIDQGQLIRLYETNIDIKKYVKSQIALYNSGMFVQFMIQKIELEDNNQKQTIAALLFSSERAHYAVKFNLTISEMKTKIIDLQILAVIQGYGEYSILNYNHNPKIKLINNYLFIPYQNKIGTPKLLAVYEIPENFNQSRKALLFFGTVPLYQRASSLQVEILKTKEGQDLLLFNRESDYLLSQYQINQSPKLIFNGTLKSQTHLLKLQNFMDKVFWTFEIKIKQSEGSSKTWLWVLLGILGLIVVSTIVVILCKKKKVVNEENQKDQNLLA